MLVFEWLAVHGVYQHHVIHRLLDGNGFDVAICSVQFQVDDTWQQPCLLEQF